MIVPDIQADYPILPADNKVQLTFLDGMSRVCSPPVFEMTFTFAESNRVATIDFLDFNKYPTDLTRERDYVVTRTFPNSEFTIKPFDVRCNEVVYSFKEFEFGKFPVSVHP